MEKTVERYLLEHGHEFARERSDGESERGFLEWFDERVLGLDSAEYRHTFWRGTPSVRDSLGGYVGFRRGTVHDKVAISQMTD